MFDNYILGYMSTAAHLWISPHFIPLIISIILSFCTVQFYWLSSVSVLAVVLATEHESCHQISTTIVNLFRYNMVISK